MKWRRAACRDALAEAEQKTDVVIAEVYLAISGAHVRSANTRVTTLINNDGDEITHENLQELHDMATAQPLPTDHAIVHHLLQNYVLDDGSMTDNPIGLASKQLTAHFHQVLRPGHALADDDSLREGTQHRREELRAQFLRDRAGGAEPEPEAARRGCG